LKVNERPEHEHFCVCSYPKIRAAQSAVFACKAKIVNKCECVDGRFSG